MYKNIKYQNLEFLKKISKIEYGIIPTLFGETLLMITQKQLVGLAFIKKNKQQTITDMKARFPQSEFIHAPEIINRFFKKYRLNEKKTPILLIGTSFQQNVWRKLCTIPKGKTIDYSTLAAKVNKQKAARAVGTAIGRNPVSWLIPCHRVIRRNGGLGGYHWGLNIKQKLLASENISL